MSARPQVFRAEWVLPVAAPPIYRGEVLVGPAGTIAAVAPAGAIDVPTESVAHELGTAILLPGLVNVHAHPELTMFRGALEDLSFPGWILRLVGAKRTVLRYEDSVAAARWAMVESLAAGITTMAVTESSGAAAGAMREARLRGLVYQEVFGPDPTQVDDSMVGLLGDLERVGSEAGDRVRVGISPHAPYTVSDALYRAATRLAIEERLPMAVHIAESAAERELVVNGGGDFAPGLRTRGIATPPRARSSIDLLHRLGVLEAGPLLVHCVDVDEEDIATIATSGCPVAHCPVANAKLGHGVSPVMRLREAGVRIGLGTDSVGSNNRIDLLEEARIGTLLQRAIARRYDALSADDLLRLCTIDGARALGMEDRIGTLEPGKEADFCVVRLGGPSTVPTYDPVVTLFHAARAADVTLTVVGGEVLYRSGQFATLDPGSARTAIEDAADRLRAR